MPLLGIEAERREYKKTNGKDKKKKETAKNVPHKSTGLRSTQAHMAMPGTGFRLGIGPEPSEITALGFMGLGPGAGPRRGLPAWLAELDRGRPPIWGGGAICGPPP
jgi:hypothetical protein